MRAVKRTAAVLLLVAPMVAFAPARVDAADQHDIDAAKSTAQFSIEHIFVDRVTGTVPIVSGSVTTAPGSPMPLAVTAVLDPARIKTDEPDRDAALSGPDYFDAKNYPTWTFSGKKVTVTGPAECTIEGLLTIHGVAQPERLEVAVRGDAAHPTYHAIAHIDRHAFGMRGARLDPVIGNQADITLDIVVN
jgi:polyisoprenoid-binding protein YceI